MSRRFRANVMQTPARDRVEMLADHLITVDEGWITAVEPFDATSSDGVDHDLVTDRGRVDDAGMILIPGLVDLHVHAPQFPQLGTGLDLPLEEWLFEHTFPLEARYDDLDFARTVWDRLVPTLLSHGTTTAVYYSSIHERATMALADSCLDHGQRAWVGRVAMDHPEGTPDWYRDPSASEGIAASSRSIEAIRSLDPGGDLVRPIVTPRFIPACTDELLAGLGRLADDTDTLIQTHCSESDWEHGHVIDRCGVTDTAALDGFGLLRNHTVLAHAGHVTDDDLVRIASNGAGIAHCPMSNAYFGNAVFPAHRVLDAGVRVGLGTDVAGGPSPSIFEQMAASVTASRMLDDGVDPALPAGERGVPGSRIDAITAFWMATLGGADVLGAPVGLLEVGRRFDAVVVDTTSIGFVDATDQGPGGAARRFEKVVRLTRQSDIRSVWTNGQFRPSATRS